MRHHPEPKSIKYISAPRAEFDLRKFGILLPTRGEHVNHLPRKWIDDLLAPTPALPADVTPNGKQTVVVIDTGISQSVPNLLYQYDIYGRDTNATNTSYHGSAVASQVLAVNPDVNIVVLKISPDGRDSVTQNHLDSALDWVIKYGKALNVTAVNISMGSYQLAATPAKTTLNDEFSTLKNQGVAVVFSAGNASSKSSVSLESSAKDVIAVSASDGAGRFAQYSNRDADLTDIVANGAYTLNGEVIGGTSFAAPLVAGAVTVVQAEYGKLYGRTLNVDQVVDVLQASGRKMDVSTEVAGTSPEAGQGYVELNLVGAVSALHDIGWLRSLGIDPSA